MGPDVVTVADIRRKLEVVGLDCPLHYDEACAQSFETTYPGDVISVGGIVTGKRVEHSEPRVTLDVWIDSPRGRTVTGSAVVSMPLSNPPGS